MMRRHFLRLTGVAAIGTLVGMPGAGAVPDADVAGPRKAFSWIGIKFSATGEVLPCPGNTIICHIDRNGPAAAPLDAYRARLEAEPSAHKFAFTPPSSYHMTIFEGVLDPVRKPGFWPRDLPLTASLEECDRLFLKKLETFDLGCEPRFRMKVAPDLETYTGYPGRAIPLVPVDAQEEAKLRTLRTRLSELLQLRQPNHDRYRFHVTQTYAIEPLTEAETAAYWTIRRDALAALGAAMPVLELGAPEFCHVESMFAFHRQLFLRRQPA